MLETIREYARKKLEEAGEVAEEALDQKVISAAWSEGRAMTLEQAVEFAR